MSISGQQRQRLRALEYLHRRGARMFPVHADGDDAKLPVRGFRTGWQTGERRNWEDIRGYAEAGYPIALVPWSLKVGDDQHLVALDWDNGGLEEAADFVSEHPPYITVPSKQEGRFHLYYLSGVQRGNGLWYWRGNVRGHIKSGGGYLVMWEDAAIIIEKYLSNPDLGVQIAFPEVVLDKPADLAEDSAQPDYAPTGDISPQRDTRTSMMDGRIDWEHVAPTVRNQTVFDALRYLAYKAPVSEFTDYETWRDHLSEIAQTWAGGITNRGPSGTRGSAKRHFTDTEVDGIVTSVAWYVWSRRGLRDVGRADSEIQARRGRRSGESRRWSKRDRDGEVMRMDALGAKQVEIAAAFGLHRNTVARIIKRKRDQESRLRNESPPKLEQMRARDEGIVMHRRMGWKIEDIGEVFGVGRHTVMRALKKSQNAQRTSQLGRGCDWLS